VIAGTAFHRFNRYVVPVNFFDPSLQEFLWVLAVALAVLVLDVFFETEFLSVSALLGISIYFTMLLDLDAKWSVLVALLCWAATIALFYLFWKRFLSPAIRRMLPAGADEAIHSAVGATGEFRLIDGRAFVSWNGDLWPVEFPRERETDEFADRERVLIESVDNGIFTISRTNT